MTDIVAAEARHTAELELVRGERQSSCTIPGVGDCPSRDSCQLQMLELVREEIRPVREGLQSLDGQVADLRGLLLRLPAVAAAADAKESSPPAGQVDVAAGSVRFRGSARLIAAVVVLVALIAGGSYVAAAVVPAKATKAK